MEPSYNTVYKITLASGGTYRAKLIHLNPQFHRKAREKDVWRREDDVPRKQRYIRTADVTKWEAEK